MGAKNGRALLTLLVILGALAWGMVPAGTAAEAPEIKRGLGLIPSVGDFPRLDTRRLATSLVSLPAVVDLSADLPPVGNQSSQGSCVGWSLGYYYKTLQERMERGWDVTSPQHQFSPSWIYNQRPTTDCARDGGMSFYSGLTILKNQGAATLDAMPYNPGNACTQPSQAARDQAQPYRIDSFANIYSGRGTANLNVLKTLLSNRQAFAIAVPVYSSFYRINRDHPVVPRHIEGETYYGGHAVLVVGYDDNMGSFKVVNSWGTRWGRDGFGYLSYDFVQFDSLEAWVAVDHVDSVQQVDIPLHAGWNLISLPVEPETTDVQALFAPLAGDLEAVYTWDVDVASWQRYTPQLPVNVNTLSRISRDKGLWLKVARECTFRLSGQVPGTRSVTLARGWNLVAYPGASPKPATEALSSIAGKFRILYGYQSATGPNGWMSYDAGATTNTLETLEPGMGYWIQAEEACAWNVD